jgi:undecaprenyl-diphosphatase
VFVAAFLESLAVVGTVVPGSSIVFAAGILAGLHALDPWLAAACAIAGAILGDAASYELGRLHRDAIVSRWPLRGHPDLVARGQAYFAKGGAKAIALGRFLGPLRAIVPLVAGMARMPAAHFYAVNVLSAVAWAAAHLVPGILFGASLELAGAVSSRLVALVAILVLAAWAIARATRLALRFGWPHVARLRTRIDAYVRTGHGPLARSLGPLFDPARHEPVALLVSAVLLVGGAWVFLGVVEDVVTKDTLVDVDQAVFAWLHGVRTRWGDDAMVVVTELGGTVVMSALVGAVAIWFAITRRFRTLAYWLSAALVGQALVFALKYALGRTRPPTTEDVIEGFSLPSGHAAQSLVVYGFLAFLLSHGKPAWEKAAFATAAVAIALLTAFSRLYLGAHWFSDVVASFGLATAWLALLAIAYIQHVREPLVRALPVLLIVLCTLVFAGGSYVGNHHELDLARYAKPIPLPTMTLAAWRAGGYASLPTRRTEADGDREEPFTIQWAEPREAIAEAFAAAGWTAPSRWRSSASLLWLAPSTPIARLPVVPKFHRGQPPTLSFVRAVDPHERLVARQWHLADAEEATGARVPIFVGMVTRERSRAEWGLVSATRTTARDVSPADALAEAMRGRHSEARKRANGAQTLLVW